MQLVMIILCIFPVGLVLYMLIYPFSLTHATRIGHGYYCCCSFFLLVFQMCEQLLMDTFIGHYVAIPFFSFSKMCCSLSLYNITHVQRSGVQFPERPPESTLIFTLAPVHAMPIIRNPPVGHCMPNNPALRLDEAMASEMSNLWYIFLHIL